MKPSAEIASYLAGLPEPRRKAIAAVRKVIVDRLPAGYEESFERGMLSYEVPLRVYPSTYNKRPLMYVALASQKSHMALYLCSVYALEGLRRALEAGFARSGKKLDMGKSCLRFQALEDLPLDVIGEAVAATPMKAYIALAESVHSEEAVRARAEGRKKAAKGKSRPEAAKPGARAKPKAAAKARASKPRRGPAA